MATSERAQWITEFKLRIKVWIIRTIKFLGTVPLDITTKNIIYQLTRSATSVGANHRASCRARSTNEFYSKISVAIEEADESWYWLELIEDLDYQIDKDELKWLINEAEEITKILSKARTNTKR